MISIDDRIGSKDLLKYFPKGEAKLTRLQYADAAFMGKNSQGVLAVGVERKKLEDLLSSMQTGRLAGSQLIGLTSSYDVVYLIIEGLWRVGADGVLEKLKGRKKRYWRPVILGKRKYMARELDSFLNTLQLKVGVLVRESGTARHTAMIIRNLYGWYQKDDHISHLAIHKNRFRDEDVLLTRPPLIRRIAAELDGVGWKRSLAVAKRFDSVAELARAREAEWLEIPGIGKTIAKRVVREIQGK
jgi:ERCC4-type nuclease